MQPGDFFAYFPQKKFIKNWAYRGTHDYELENRCGRLDPKPPLPLPFVVSSKKTTTMECGWSSVHLRYRGAALARPDLPVGSKKFMIRPLKDHRAGLLTTIAVLTECSKSSVCVCYGNRHHYIFQVYMAVSVVPIGFRNISQKHLGNNRHFWSNQPSRNMVPQA